VVDVAGTDQSATEQRREDLAAEDEALHRLVDGADAVHVVRNELVVGIHAPQPIVDFRQSHNLPFLWKGQAEGTVAFSTVDPLSWTYRPYRAVARR